MRIVFLLFSLSGPYTFSQIEIDTLKVIRESRDFKLDQDRHFLNKKTSPLTKKERRKFKEHRFFPVNMDYCVVAKFERIENGDTVIMKTSANTEKVYIKFAKVYFTIEEVPCELTVYQNVKLSQIKEYEDYLFIPFRDQTSGQESYGGGRYIDLKIPEEDEIILNFNLAYNPYCAYTEGYFCPIPPNENILEVEIKAGAMIPRAKEQH